MQNNNVTEKDFPIEPIWLLKGPLTSIIVLLLFFLPLMAFIKFVDQDPKALADLIENSLILVLWLVLIPFHFLLDILRLKNYHYQLDDTYINLRQGIISKQNRIIPYGAIQHVSVHQTLLDRIFGLTSVTIENASDGGGQTTGTQGIEMVGFQSNVVSIPGLSTTNAQTIKKMVLEKITKNPIEERGM